MTREEIMNMPAGRGMDALIAEHIFGWKPTTDGWFMVPKDQFPKYWKETDMEDMPKLYSTDIAAAWEVVEKFDNRCMLNNVHGVWECYFEGVRGEAKTASLAICRAALLAVNG